MTHQHVRMPPIRSPEFDSAEKEREEAKRERMTNPQVRWQMLQQAIAWGEQQKTVRRNTREACLRRQALLLAGLANDAGPSTS
jgi:hypothetical protein